MSTLANALSFAERFHKSQTRKYTGEPYIVHPRAVVELVKTVPHTKEMLMAAALHDVVEDTPVTFEAVENTFGTRVALIVDELTEVTLVNKSEWNRMTRKDLTWRRIRSWEAQTIKCADLIDNTKTIAVHDPKFAAVYLREKEALLLRMDRADDTLRAKAWNSIDWARSQL